MESYWGPERPDEKAVIVYEDHKKWSSMTVPFIGKSTRRNSSWPGALAPRKNYDLLQN
jgi:hypothetical protein